VCAPESGRGVEAVFAAAYHPRLVSLLTWLADEFSSPVRARGREYFQDGCVFSLTRSGGIVRAKISGTREYSVRVDLRGAPSSIRMECNCPFATDRDEPCKHIWAALLEANSRGLLEGSDVTAHESADGKTHEHEHKPRSARTATWQRHIRRLREAMGSERYEQRRGAWPADRRLIYVIDIESTMNDSWGVVLELWTQAQQRDGQWAAPKRMTLDEQTWLAIPDETDRQIAHLLLGAHGGHGYGMNLGSGNVRRFVVPPEAYDLTLKTICQTGRCMILPTRDKREAMQAVTWDDGPPWEFVLRLRIEGELAHLAGEFRRGEQMMALNEPALVLSGGVLVTEGRVAKLNHHGAWTILASLRDGLDVKAPAAKAMDVLSELYAMPRLPPIEMPADIDLTESRGAPKPRLTIRGASRDVPSNAKEGLLSAEVAFDYDGHIIPADGAPIGIIDEPNRRIVRRDIDAEENAVKRLEAIGFHLEWDWDSQPLKRRLVLLARKLPVVVPQLIREGWHIEAEGKLYRQAGKFNVRVSSGIDWFELDATVDFGGTEFSLPQLLAALKRGEQTVTLDDGTVGILPEEWLKKYAPLAELASEADDNSLRFTASQVGFLDALISDMPEVRVDETFERARQQLRSFEGVRPLDAPGGFVGELRPYQRDGLGWLQFLNQFRFGGCLADDMGLGKTIQVLALLEARRAEKAGPSLVVVPKSLVWNWEQEAARFTPSLRVLAHSGAQRLRSTEHFENYDLVITTYGTLRRDAGFFKDTTFDYAILDEAQAIKNADTESAKAARLLRANHRLAMSGTPIENHLGELWSLFEFLNPGLLGGARVFKSITTGQANGKPDTRTRQILAKALRPFILRRTKQQVASDLPEKTEQTIFCELEPAQRQLYDELRDHYRQSLLGRIDEVGINKSKMHVLEALLRLRQAACHPGLIDQARSNEPSAKIDALLAQLEEVVEEGHKALVFSQFTSLLAILRQRLESTGATYEYLDGQTRDRQQRVERFQNDEQCRLFLISLKAGGLGLNLTAADYVFLLDPWWNPAIEAQAIDRAHRIGQTKSVFAYRLIARDTVEEKVLELQRSKRDLADAIINADNSLVSGLGREEIELLLS
jgi:hypothetical protein